MEFFASFLDIIGVISHGVDEEPEITVVSDDCALDLAKRDLYGAEVCIVSRSVNIQIVGRLLVCSADAMEDESASGSAVLVIVEDTVAASGDQLSVCKGSV